MTKISSFPGIRYNKNTINDPAEIIAPPYDKISTELRKKLWQRHEHNVVKLILPPPSDVDVDVMTQSMDTEGEDWYAEAAARLKEWIKQGVLVVDEPLLYVYKQTYSYQGVTRTRTGLFVSLELEDTGGPHAHENTFEGPKADRLKLLRATQTNTSPIFLLSDGEWDGWQQIFSKAKDVLLDFTDEENQHHELLALSNGPALQAAMDYIHDRTLVIADGHHRYETAVNYRREMMLEKGATTSAGEPWGSCFALVVPIQNPGLIVLPTHRVLSQLPDGWMNQLKEKAAAHCEIQELTQTDAESIRQALDNAPEQSIVAYAKDQAVLLTMKDPANAPGINELPEATRSLNVSMLHQYILQTLLGLSNEDLQGKVRYVRGEENAIQHVQSGDFDGAFMLKGISPEDVFDVSLQGVRMPQKSTDFFPKIPTGLVLRPASNEYYK